MKRQMSRLSKRLILALLFFSLITTILVSIGQLSYDYNRLVQHIEDQHEVIRVTQQESIGGSLWDVDVIQIEKHLAGLLKFPYVVGVEVYSDERLVVEKHTEVKTGDISSSFPLYKYHSYSNKKIKIGKLIIHSSLAEVRGKLYERAVFILMTNGFEYFILIVFVIFIFYYFIFRHLNEFLMFIHTQKEATRLIPFVPKKRKVKKFGEDEMDDMISVYNSIIGKLQDSLDLLKHNESELKKHQYHLEELVEKRTEEFNNFYMIVEQIPMTVAMTDTEGNFVYANPHFSKTTGYDKAEIIGKNPNLMKSGYHEQEYYQELWETIKSGKVWSGEFLNLTKNGEKIWESALILPLRDKHHSITHFVTVKEDVTEKKRLDEQLTSQVDELARARQSMLNMMEDLEISKSKAEEATKAKSEFLANMSHEIRTPMNAILGMTHLSLRTNLTIQQKDYLTKIHISTNSLLGLINDILDFSKIEAGKMDIESTVFDLDTVMTNLSTSVSTKAQEKNLEFLIQSHPDVPKQLIGDPLRLGQILINLVGNAVKFTDQGEVLVKVEIDEESPDNNLNNQIRLKFMVKDTGIGMKQDNINKLFQPFSQADSSTTRKFGGTGLGLPIVKQLVDMMKGEIRVECELGKGCVFVFNALFGVQSDVNEVLYISQDLGNMRVLVVDDNESSRNTFQILLEPLNFQVVFVESGEHALNEIDTADSPFELIMVDWKMPNMDGIELTKKIRTADKSLSQPKIILFTAFNWEDILLEDGGDLFDGFLSKPVTSSLLYDGILEAFSGNKKSQKDQLDPWDYDEKQLNPIRGAQILLAEDNEINQQIIREILEQAGFKLKIVDNGKKAVQEVQKNDYKAILMDIQMPIMDGYAATRKIRSLKGNDNIPIIAMTADAFKKDKDKALAVGMNDHISKPIHLEQLFNILVKWIKPGPYSNQSEKHPQTGEGETIRVFPLIDGINTAKGLSLLRDNHTLYKDLLVKFYHEQQALDQEIRKALQNGNQEVAHRLIHTIKGISGNLGADELSRITYSLDALIKHKKLKQALNAMEPFQKEFKRVLEGLKVFVESEQTVIDEPESSMKKGVTSLLADLLEKLVLHLSKQEPKPIKKIMSEITLYQWSETYNHLIEQLGQYISRYRFDDALHVARELAELLVDAEKTKK